MAEGKNKDREEKEAQLAEELRYKLAKLQKEKPAGKGEIEAKEAEIKEIEKIKSKLDDFKKEALKKYNFIISMGLLPPQANEKIEEEEEMSEEERKEKKIHMVVIIPEEKFKELPKIKLELVKEVKDIKPKVWLHVLTPVDVWNYCLDGKYDIVSAISMSFPVYDKGFLGVLRVSEIHKTLVLKKFEKYVVSYVIVGSIMRGTATKTSDADVFIVIDDTDVKRMPRLELKEKLRAIIYSYVAEAASLAGVKNTLHIQTYLLTEFWDAVKDAHPVIFTFIRDGVPLFDKGTFMPWKLLLKMGKLKPSPEAIDMFMISGEKTKEMVERRLIDAMIDIYYGVLNPSQALIMLYGAAPPAHKETVAIMREIFVEKEKLLEKKYIDILEKCIQLFKDYEHEKLKTIKGEEIDKLMKDADDYMKRLKELREQIEKVSQEKTIKNIDSEVFNILENLFGKKSREELVKDFDKNLVKKGKMPYTMLTVLKDLVHAKEQFKKGKLAKHDVETVRKNASQLISHLIEYGQRNDLITLEKGRMQIVYGRNKDKRAEMLITDSISFLITQEGIKKITSKLEDATKEEMEKALSEQKGKLQTKSTGKIFDVLKKELGEFEIVL